MIVNPLYTYQKRNKMDTTLEQQNTARDPCCTVPVFIRKMGEDGKGGIENRVWYLNIVSVMMILLSSLIAGTVNAPVKIGNETFARWEKCALSGATEANDGCNQMLAAEPAEVDAAMLVMERVFTLSLVLAILNGITLLIGAIDHNVTFLIDMIPDRVALKVMSVHFQLQSVLSIVNIGLFAGTLGWMEEGLFAGTLGGTEEINFKHSVYLKGVNIYTTALVGLVFSVLDLVVFYSLKVCVFAPNERCGVKQVAQVVRYLK